MQVVIKYVDQGTGEIKHKFTNAKDFLFKKYGQGKDSLDNFVMIPCGRCPECREKWRKQLAQRTRYELLSHENKALFITLTFNNESLEKFEMDKKGLLHRPFQLFMKRLRITLERKGFTNKISYLMCGEYGGEKGRPHYHALIFGISERDLESLGFKIIYTRKRTKKGHVLKGCDELADIWQNGFIELGDAQESTAPYMAKYMVKYGEISQKDWEEENGEIKKPYMVYPHKTMGIDYFLDNIESIVNRGFVYSSNKSIVGIPGNFVKYLKNRLYDETFNKYFSIIEKRKEEYFEEVKAQIKHQGMSFYDWFLKEINDGITRREIYNSYKKI